MALQANTISSWETYYADHEKSIKSLFTDLASAASGKTELEERLKKEVEAKSMWYNLFIGKQTELDKLKRESEEQNRSLERDHASFKADHAELNAKYANLIRDYEALLERQTALQQNESTFSVVLIDGDGLIFDPSYLKKGTEGGTEAAQALRNGVKEHFAVTGSQVRIHVYLNKLGLSKALNEDKIVSVEEFSAFVMRGFQAAHKSTAVIDVGYGKEAADAKIHDAMTFFAGLPECKLLILGASHDNGYSNLLKSLRTEGKMDRIRLLKGYECVAQELKEFEEWTGEIPNLFRSHKLGSYGKPTSRSISPSSPKSPNPASFSAVAKSGAGPNDPNWRVVTRKAANPAQIMSIKGLKPRPCYAQYLRDGCGKYQCTHGHDYDLSDTAVTELAEFAKRFACEHWLKNKCPFDDDTCLNGHRCRNGYSCFYRNTTCFFQKWHDENPSPGPGARAK